MQRLDIKSTGHHVLCLLSLLVYLCLQIDAQSFGMESCSVAPHHVTVEPEADVTLGAVLPIHHPGEGVYGCGHPTPDGVQVFEAMRWAVDVLNHKSGLISESGELSSSSLIPGVRIGLKAFDSCGHNALAMEHLTSLFPVLRSGPKFCDKMEENSTLTIGVVDMSGVSSTPEVAESFRDYLIPSIELSMTTTVPPERMAQVLLTATKDLRWSNIVIIHEDEEYSISVTKQLTQATATGRATCISNIYALPRVLSGHKSNRRDLRSFRRAFRAATIGLADGAAVIVITKGGEPAAMLLQVMAEFPDLTSKIQWLFSWIPPPSLLSEMGRTLSGTSYFYSITPYPEKVLQFEEYWSSLQGTTSFSNPDDYWFLEYLMSLKGCKFAGIADPVYRALPLCTDRTMRESSLEILLRTSRAVPALTSIFTLATAFHKAWESKCQDRPGICPELRAMNRKEFVSQFLEPVEFLVGRDSGSGEDTGRRSPRQSADEKLEGSKLSLTQYLYNEQRGVHFRQVIVYESQGSRILDHDFVSLPSQCSIAGCRGCVRPRQSRLEDSLQDLDSHESMDIGSREEDILIPLLVPLHEPGLSPMECGSVINSEAVQNLEAALWTVDRINEDRASLAGARLGIAVIDTCSSALLATQKLATYVTNSHLDQMSSLAFVSTTSADETLAGASVLKPLNISIISSSDLTHHLNSEVKLGRDHHLLQVSAAAESLMMAALEVFDYNGWRFVTIIHEDTPVSIHGLHSFQKAAKQKGICVGQQLKIDEEDLSDGKVDKLIQRLLEIKKQGSSVVVLLTSADSTRRIITGLGRFLEASVLHSGDLVMVGLGGWSETLNIVQGLEKVAVGSLILRPEQGEVSEFATHYSQLLPESNPRNPWYKQLWRQEEMRVQMDKENASSDVLFVEYAPFQSTTNTIQAIIAVAAGIASVRNELCQLDMGLCPVMGQHPQLQQLVGEYIYSSVSPRLDQPGQKFKFTDKGYGELPIEVYNFRKISGKIFNYLKVGTYSGQYTKLANMVTYKPQGEISMDSVMSTCIEDCIRCQYSATNHVTIPSSQDLYIAVTLGIHEPTSNPLACGPLKTSRGFQNFESLLWAVDLINSNPNILPGADLGLIVFDTCNSREKVAMDVSNFLTEIMEDKDSLPSPRNVVGFIADGTKDEVRPLLDLTMPLGMSTVAPFVVAPEFGEPRYTHLLRMSMPSKVVITSIVNTLRYFHWKYVSVVYTGVSDSSLMGLEGFQEFEKQASEHNIQIAVVEKVGIDEDMAPTMDIIAHRLKIKQNAGARVVVLLLPPSQISQLLSAVKRLQHLGRSHIGDFVWVAYDALEPFQMFPDQSTGALVLRSRSEEIPQFKDYFMNLDVKNNSRNPWLREYWEQVFNCRGNSCSRNQAENLKNVGFVQDRSVPNTVNAFLTLALGLDSLQKHLCSDETGWCAAMKNKLKVRENLFEHARKITFTGLDGTPIKFDSRNYVSGKKIDLFNFREVGDVRAFLNVGIFDEDHGLFINATLTRGYNEQREPVPLEEVLSFCNDSEICANKPDTALLSLPFMKIPANQEFVIGVMIPVHKPGDNFFTCSRIVEEKSFQNLLALSYALEKVNSNSTILPQIQLGALVFDHCGRRQKAEEQIFSFIASDGSLPYSEAGLRSRAMVAALTYDPVVADDLSPLFESVLIPQISTPTGLVPIAPERKKRSSSEEGKQINVEVQVVVDLLKRFDWRLVTLLHSGSENDRSIFWNFVDLAKERKVCISESLVIKPEMSISDMAALFTEELGPDQESRIIVVLLEDSDVLHNVLEAAKQASIIEDFVWISIETKRGGVNLARTLQGTDVDFFLVRPETYEVPGFREYYSGFNLNNHYPIPDVWFDEFWQHHFRCHLPQSSIPLKQLFPDTCRGTESLTSLPLSQDTFVYHTVFAVTTVAEALHDYLRRYCAHGDAATNLEDCGGDARQILWREMRKLVKGPPVNCIDGDCGPLKISVGYQIFQLRKEKVHHVYQQVGLWKDNELALKMEDVSFLSGIKKESACVTQCQKCLNQLALNPEELSLPKPGIYSNFRSMWGIIVSALSILGVLLVIICAAYFLISFQVTVGTTVLGYMILFGLLLLYAVNFAFILAPTEGTCGIRRFGLGLAYAIIFSGMLVKVMNIWRMMGYRGNQFLGESYHLTSPAALLVVAVGLVIIQVLLSSAWLILIPPTTGIHGGEWRCHPATTFEDELVISLVYVMLMLAITILFSVLTWSSKDNNRESRWIFTCCFLMAFVWIAWTVVSTQILHRYRDLTISVANLICATIVMLCMYLRKVYIYNKLTKDQENKAKIQQTMSLPAVPNMYGTLSRTVPGITPVTSFQSGPRLVALAGKMMDRTAPSRMALITSEDGNTSDSGSGSVQVQATDLYPLDMYDGGSQFQPSSLKLGGSSLVLDETSPNLERS